LALPTCSPLGVQHHDLKNEAIRMKNHRFKWVRGILAALPFFAALPTLAADVTVDLNTTYQTIDGFGAMQDKGWTGYNLTSADYNTAFGNGPGQLGLTILRIRLYETQSQWGQDLVDAKAAYSRGMKVFATAWSPPTNLRVASGSSYKIDPSKYQAYVDHLNAFSAYMKTNGVNLYAIGFQNEPDWCSEWGCGTTTEMVNFAKNWGSKIRANGNKVISAESFSFNKGYYDGILNDASALSSIDILGTHFYGTSKSSGDNTFDYTLFKTKGGKTPFWMTEVYTDKVNDQGSKAWPLCLDVAYEMHRALGLSNMSAYVWWYMKRNYGPLWISANNATAAASNGQVSKVGAIMAQYSKYIRPGAVRVGATRVVQSDVYTTAFKKNDSIVVVSVNRNAASKTVTYSIAGMKATTGSKITTSGTKDIKDDGDVVATGGNFSVTLEGQSISTIVFSGNTVSVDPKPYSSLGSTTGAYKVFKVSGELVGQVDVAEGTTLNTEVRKLSPKAGLYVAKSPNGSESIPVSILP
jgi:glucuronoarabinoxylan endo-1,4-beta-xylanase